MEKLSDVKKLSEAWGVSPKKALSVMRLFRKVEALNDRHEKISVKRNDLLRKVALRLKADNCSHPWNQFQNTTKCSHPWNQFQNTIKWF